MIAIAPVLLRACRRLALYLALTLGCSAWDASAAAASAGPPGDAALESDPAQIRCSLESARLDFGHLQWPLRTRYVGVGEITAICHNPSGGTRRAELTLAFPTMGRQGAVLRRSRGTLTLTFYRDPQLAERWDDNRNGAGIVLELLPGEQRRLRLSVYAVLHADRNAEAGVYTTQLPITLSAHPIQASPKPR